MKKIEGVFYPLQHEEWLRACQELTPSQRDVLYFIRTLDPYGIGVELTPADIAKQLSSPKKTVHRSTVTRALKELDAKEFISMELLRVRVTVNPKGIHCCRDATMLSDRNNRCGDATTDAMTQQPMRPDNIDIYKESARAKDYLDLEDSKEIPPNPPTHGEEEREKQLGFEMPEPEEEDLTHSFAKEHIPEIKATQVATVSSESNYSAAARDNKTKADYLLEEYDSGRITFLPKNELLLLAQEAIGDCVRVYRRSGRILASSRNDLDNSFVQFAADKHCRGDLQNADAMIVNWEKAPESWRKLVGLVDAWQQSLLNAPVLIDENGEESTGATARIAAYLATNPDAHLWFKRKDKC